MKRLAFAAALLAVVAALCLFGIPRLNHPKQTIVGVDVSHYQCEVDWPTLVGQSIQFAYIKATEGSGSVDSTFAANLKGAMDAGLPVGAYHFFSYDSPGANQAEHFIKTVPNLPGMLPPVIDVEFYGDYYRKPAEVGYVEPELRAMVEGLTDHYGRWPMIYATERSYRLYIKGRFDDCPLWIRNVYWTPGENWTIWQYTDRGRLKGFKGDTPYIDMDVYYGDRASFDAWTGAN